MFKWLFNKTPRPVVVTQPVNEIFNWPAHVTLIIHDRLTLALPKLMLGENDPIGSVIECNDDAEISIPNDGDRFYLRLQAGMSVTVRKSVQSIVLPYAEDDDGPKRIEVMTK